MKILALELSSARRSVAVLAEGQLCGQAAATGTAGTTALGLVERALLDARVEREQIGCIAVGLGPGSYTGIRAAIAVAQGWQLARAVRLAGISSVECLAAQAHAAGFQGRVSIAIDAQRDEFYLATYALDQAGAHLIEPLRLVGFEILETRVNQGDSLVGPEIGARLPGARPLFPDAAALGRLAASRTDSASGETLQPVYLRDTNFVKAPPPRTVPPLDLNKARPPSDSRPATDR